MDWGEILKKSTNFWGGYYDPPFKCRVPNLRKTLHKARWGKGLKATTFERHFGDILGDIFGFRTKIV